MKRMVEGVRRSVAQCQPRRGRHGPDFVGAECHRDAGHQQQRYRHRQVALRLADGGRVSGVSGNVYVDESQKKYVPLSLMIRREAQRETGLYASDNWRFRPSLTLNYGVRWEYQGAAFDRNGIYTSRLQRTLGTLRRRKHLQTRRDDRLADNVRRRRPRRSAVPA